MNIDIIAVGRLKSGPELDLIDQYLKRMQWSLRIIEIDARKNATQAEWQNQIDKLLPDYSVKVFMDERGKNLGSVEFADLFKNWQLTNAGKICFCIGGADGFASDFVQKADVKLSLGKLTWPHMLARLMLVEQIYRSQQIIANHPYHRE